MTHCMNDLVLVFQKKAWGAWDTQSEKEDNMTRTLQGTMPLDCKETEGCLLFPRYY